MKVDIKSFDVEMAVKTKGIEFQVYSPDGATHHGDLILSKKNLEWCKGRKRRGNGKVISWKAFMDWAESQ